MSLKKHRIFTLYILFICGVLSLIMASITSFLELSSLEFIILFILFVVGYFIIDATYGGEKKESGDE